MPWLSTIGIKLLHGRDLPILMSPGPTPWRRAADSLPEDAQLAACLPGDEVPARDLLTCILESSPHAMLVVGPSRRVALVNARAEREFGYARAELIGQPVETILPHLQAPRNGHDQCARCKDGSEIAVEINLTSLHTDSGVFVLASVARELGLPSSPDFEHFYALANDLPVMIWVSDAEKSCRWFNRRWLEFVGCTMEQQLGSGWTEVVHPEDVESCLDAYRSAFDARRPLSTECRLRRKDGEWRWVVISALPSYAPDGAFAGYIGSCLDVTGEKEAKIGTENALREVRRLRDQLRGESAYVRRQGPERFDHGIAVGQSAAARRVLEQVEQVAPTDSTVLLLGETGTGKELCATQIHERSSRRGRPMIRVNCAAIPSTLIESELFGREKGAFTGALARQIGRFEMADHSTIFLDEIGDLPGEVQIKLLRVLEERQIERLGSPRVIPVDTRIVAATHRNLEQLMTAGTFRDDLYYRLHVFPIQVPALRQRVEDIPLLVWHFVEEFSKAFGKRIESIGKKDLAALQEYPWPGNIRELRNVVERAMITATGPRLTIELPQATPTASRRSVKLVDVERSHIRSVLESSRWRIRGVGGAAEQLGLKPTTLETRLAKLGLKRPS
jgi:formate hydrogenlyase transcriptional activator